MKLNICGINVDVVSFKISFVNSIEENLNEVEEKLTDIILKNEGELYSTRGTQVLNLGMKNEKLFEREVEYIAKDL